MILFIHNPHTGGTAIATELRRRGQLANDWDWGHMSAREWQMFQPELWNSSEKLAAVRNPWDRLVAIYHHELKRWDIKIEFEDWLLRPPNKIIHPFDYRRISQFDYLKTIEGFVDYKIMHFETDLKSFEPYYHLFKPERGLSAKRPHYSSFYTERAKRFVDVFFTEDIARWGYTFDTR
jgi:hypothetical protein